MTNNLNKLNPQQQQGVTHTEGPLLIVAGAGTGKTTVITERINWLICEQQLSTDNILALTFTEKAAGEMEQRLDQLLPMGYVDLWVSTFHSFTEKILRTHGLDIGLPTDFTLLTPTDSWLLIKKNLARFQLDYYRPLGNPTKFIHALLQHFSRCKDECITPAAYIAYAESLVLDRDDPEQTKRDPASTAAFQTNEIAQAYHTYQQLLLEHSALDFGDVLTKTIELFTNRPHILKQYQQQFKYILVDEFQDTNVVQYQLIKLLSSEENQLTVVGDDDQSIYKFRGASVENILKFKQDFPNCTEIVLTENYRSGQSILDLAYAFIQHNNPDRLEASLQTVNASLSKQLHSQLQEPGVVEYHHATSLESELDWIGNMILSLNTQGVGFDDCAILVRSNDAATEVANMLQHREIPYQFLAARGLYYKPIIRDITNYLRLLDTYRETPALYRILSMPILQIPQKQIQAILYWAGKKQTSLYETLKQVQAIPGVVSETVIAVQKLEQWITAHTSLAARASVWKVVMAFLTDSGYLRYIQSLAEEPSKEMFSQLNQFAKKIKQFEQHATEISVADFLEEFEMELESGESGSLIWDDVSGTQMVTVMTMHTAKGLEFPYVFVPNMVDKRMPTITRKEPIEIPDALLPATTNDYKQSHLQEERRLLYVAITRAKYGLFLSSAADYGGARMKKPSIFIQELGFTAPTIPTKEITIPKKQTKHTTTPTKHTYSFTQIEAYQKCPLQYKFAHILRVPVRGTYTLSFGKTMHAVLQQFLEQARQLANTQQPGLFENIDSTKPINDLPSKKELLRLYEQLWIDDWYDSATQKKEYKTMGKQALEKFYDDWITSPRIPTYLEKGFHVKIGQHTLRGVIDRIDTLADGSLEIIDYKTGEPKDKKNIKKTQLLIYQLATNQAFDRPISQLTFYYLTNGTQVHFLGTDKEIDAMQEKIITTITAIESGDFTPTPNKHTCGYCDFRYICDFAQV